MIEEPFFSTEFDGQRRRCVRRNCANCGALFIVPVNRKQAACSPPCAIELRKRRVTTSCAACDKTFETTPSKLAAAKGALCCSRTCRNNAQRLSSGAAVVRPKHFGTATGRQHAVRVRKEWLNNHVGCASCGITFPPMLTMHHIDGDESNNDVANLECVCWLHHAARHMRLVDGKWTYSTISLTPRDKIGEVEALIEAGRRRIT